MKALITGASGFVGRYLINFLHGKGIDVSTLGRESLAGAKHYNLPQLWNKEELADVVNKIRPDYFFHLAGSSQTEYLQESLSINVCLGADLLDAVSKLGLQHKTKCLLFGSAAEYGFVREESLPLDEEFCCKPYSDYGISKLAQTHYASAWSMAGGKALVVRPFTILGKGMPVSLAIGDFAIQLLEIVRNGGNGTLSTGNLDVTRDFVDVNDVVDICWKLINLDKACGQVVNICSGNALNLRVIVEYMIQLVGGNVLLETKTDRIRSIDMKHHYGDNSKLMKLIGEFEFTPWQVSVKQMIEMS